MNLQPGGRAKRHPLWSRETFLSDLEKYREIKRVCVIYSTKENWRGNYSDVWRWRKMDPDFDKKVSAILDETGKNKSTGRPLKKADKDWMDDFCDSLYLNNGNRAKAAESAGYSLRQINEMLDIGSSSYNEEFTKRVEEVISRITAELEEMLISLRDKSNFESFNLAKIAQTKGWIALKTLEKLEPKRYGRRAELNVSGTVQHQHRLERTKSREELIADLIEDQKRFMEARKKQLALQSGPDERASVELNSADRDVIDAEVLEVKVGIRQADND